MKAKNKVGKKVDRFENKVDDKLKEKLLDDEYVIDDRVVISESSDYVYELPQENIFDDDKNNGYTIYIFEHFGLGSNNLFADDSNSKRQVAEDRFISFFKSLTRFKHENEKYFFISDAIFLFENADLIQIIKDNDLFDLIYLDKDSLENCAEKFVSENLFKELNIWDYFDFIENIRFASKVITL